MQALTHRVLHWADTQPNKMAIDDGSQALSYQELAARAKILASHLQAVGVEPGDRVVILLPKSNDAIVAILGTLLVNATYVPVDTSSPKPRLQSILDDSEAKAIVVSDSTSKWFNCAPVVNIKNAQAISSSRFEPSDTDLSSPAYILYTSGSTGTPNGVCISHQAMYAFFTAVNCYMGITRNARCMNTSALYFDVSIADVLLPLYQGASVWLGPNIPLPLRYLDILSTNRITHFCGVGSTLTMLSAIEGFNENNFADLSCIMTGAEVLNPNTIAKWLDAAPNTIVLNGYGPTETTCVCTVFEISKENIKHYSDFPIGTPLPDINVMLDKKDGNDFGELCIAGPQVMNNYLKRDTLNHTRLFIHNDKRYYRTGDRVQYDQDGNLIFLGRIDEQVKVNGYRIHLGEVAAPFLKTKGVQDVVVLKVDHAQHGECLAVIVKVKDLTMDLSSLKTEASKQLPSYMRPLLIAQINKMPLSASGKVNAKLVRSLALEHYQQESSYESIIATDNEELAVV
ncbi:amino acid adenylation domain-containing protein [Catenovulum sp. SM1970]|uniref:amino acid adenylation domain-containing protein n=1 Tax=Marinifaba aquimaris TaxID=2741323 RepID=UPI0015717E64|nr:amino acid adenylation domain-containing protein [Marinifaba aquimaris]NTS75296.1 amino acid adenylation domain-containing protein [Marinifaba aquimaris]